ncbi:PTS IIA-like nitrogen-regulatory protein PtsN [hydrothermal vent metagenome]|uniref:PTS IIA-like nitrogen-regulatory protein PtsN n=1 Tax=hydrothermal vent metagenome TaxID=652676 RepID=A0A3B1BGY5_9ZZZZ
MFPANFITAARIDCNNQASSKKRALERVSKLLATATPGLSEENVFEQLLERERLGSTGLGYGIALPHARMTGLTQACGTLVHLDTAIDYDAIDGQPVDLIFGLLVPHDATQEHLQLLARLATLFSNADFRERIRAARDGEAIMEIIQHESKYSKTA